MARGEPITKIAKSLGYADHSGITERLGDDPEYQAALRAGIYAKLETREGELETAPDNVSVTRADRLLGHTRWWAEKINPAQFGQRSHLTVENVGDLGERLRRARERVIDADVVEIQHDAAQQSPELGVSDTQQIIEE
jgi:hypothetical protein